MPVSVRGACQSSHSSTESKESACGTQYEGVKTSQLTNDQDISDSSVLAAVHDELKVYANDGDGIAIVETAGGVLSPSPSGSSQADLYRPLRLPVLLVGDHRLGGIGTTISAWESLHVRGYDVQSVALFAEERYDNHSYLKDYFKDRGVNAFAIPGPPQLNTNATEDTAAMRGYYNEAANNPTITAFTTTFLHAHDTRVASLQSMPAEADRTIWHPFMQHSERTPHTILAIDSAHGDLFQTHTTQAQPRPPNTPLLTPSFDGSASWWTQGLGHSNPRLALTAAHAAGRYGHVMFAGAVHEPALHLARTLLQRMENPRLAKVFYTDNGSTGMEVAVKMALRAATLRNGWRDGEEDVLVLGLRGSYHGDTIGTMDCSEPGIYNRKVEWYQGRGHWLDFPQVKMRKGEWTVETPGGMEADLGGVRTFGSLDEIFDFEAREEDRKLYRDYCDAILRQLHNQGKKLGALIMEPVLLGAGGMMFADPLFQRTLVDSVRNSPQSRYSTLERDWSGMPVIFDEVFTGLYRLGRFSAASFLGVHPDIVVNAKLLTGGLLPLCTTTASQTIFEAFLSKDKSDALLHGHSYTAHAVGCAVANYSLEAMMRMDRTATWVAFKDDWKQASLASTTSAATEQPIWSMWSNAFAAAVSQKSSVDYVFALGSVLAISLKDPAGASYASTAATGLRDQLLAGVPGDEWVIHSRVLGNVLYLMAAMTTSKATLAAIEERVLIALEQM